MSTHHRITLAEAMSAYAVYQNQSRVCGNKTRRTVRRTQAKQVLNLNPNLKKSKKKKKAKVESSSNVPDVRTVCPKKKIVPDTSSNVDDEVPPKLVKIDPSLISTAPAIKQRVGPRRFKARVPEDNPIIQAQRCFQLFLGKVKPDTFFANYWESKVLVTRANEILARLLKLSTVDEIARDNLLSSRDINITFHEDNTREPLKKDTRLSRAELWEHYLEGSEITILHPQSYSRKIHQLMSSFQEYFSTLVRSEIVLSSPQSKVSIQNHTSSQTFITQFEGSRRYNISTLKTKVPTDSTSDEPESVKQELTLKEGQVLYLPDNTVYNTVNDDNTNSLSLIIRLDQNFTYGDLLAYALPQALELAAQNNIEYRRGLPLNYLKLFDNIDSPQDETSNEIRKNVKQLTLTLENYINIDLAADQIGKRFMCNSIPPKIQDIEKRRTSKFDGPFLEDGKVYNRVEINLDTKVRLLRYFCCRLVKEKKTLKLFYNTENPLTPNTEEEQWLHLNKSMIPAIKLLHRAYPNYIEVESLPMEDVTAKMQLVADLWERGILVSSKPLRYVFDDDDGTQDTKPKDQPEKKGAQN